VKKMAKKTENMRQKSHERVDKILDRAEQINEKGKETLENVKAKMRMMRENADDHIRKNPESSVLIATGVGIVLGSAITAMIMRRRRH
jgi:ElaB/YqjD/DUF883 family membrane-anchored ribosome-binding protein